MTDDFGPPTREDDMWFQLHVVQQDYPPLRRGEKQFAGQIEIDWKVVGHTMFVPGDGPILLNRGIWFVNGEQVEIEIPGYYVYRDGSWELEHEQEPV